MNIRSLILGIYLIAVLCSSAAADRVALLPLADLSSGANGVNLGMTGDLAEELRARGLELVSQDDVFRFLDENRVRSLGALDSFLARKIGIDLNCQLVLVGTITETQNGKSPALAVTLSALDTVNGLPVWAATRSVSLAGSHYLLGLGEPKNLDDLKKDLFEKLFADMNRQLTVSRDETFRGYQIVSLDVSPGVVRGSTWTDCFLRINFLEKAPHKILLQSKDQSWELEDCGKGHLYRGRLQAPQTDGSYPLGLILEWNDKGDREVLNNVASIEVINQSPEFQMDVKKGMQVGDIVAFRDHLLLIPEIQASHSVERWTLEIADGSGTSIVYEEHEGSMPDKMVWDGRDSQRRQLVDGVYSLKFQVWDGAGNIADVEKKVALQTAPPTIEIASVQKPAGNYLVLSSSGKNVVPFEDWKVTVKSSDGKIILQQQGQGLPAEFELPRMLGNDFRCDLEAADGLGNRSRLANVAVRISEPEEMFAKDQHSGSWLEDF